MLEFEEQSCRGVQFFPNSEYLICFIFSENLQKFRVIVQLLARGL